MSLDAKLPRGTVKRDARIKGAFYDVDSKKIHLPAKASSRSKRHEKAHFIWQERMTPAQRKEFNAAMRPKMKGVVGRDIPMGRVQKDGGTYGEEMFAIMYAGHKEGRKFASPLKAFFRRFLK